MTLLENFYEQQLEPNKSCLLALRNIIIAHDENITASWKYGGPFFCYKNKMFCYLWVHKKLKQPYIGIIEGKHFDEPYLLTENRTRIKTMLINAKEDLPIENIKHVIQKAIGLYKNDIIKIR